MLYGPGTATRFTALGELAAADLEQLTKAVLDKGYTWIGAPGSMLNIPVTSGDIWNPYTGAVVGNALAIGLAGVQRLPNAGTASIAWKSFQEFAYSKGWLLGVGGSLHPVAARQDRAVLPVTFNDLAELGTANFNKARQFIESLPDYHSDLSAAPSAVVVPLPPPPPPKTITTAAVAVTSAVPNGWHQGTVHGKDGYFAPDGLWYPGTTPWTAYVPGSGESFNVADASTPPPAPPPVHAYGPPPPAPDYATTATSPMPDYATTAASPASATSTAADTTTPAPATAGFGGVVGVLALLGIAGAALYMGSGTKGKRR